MMRFVDAIVDKAVINLPGCVLVHVQAGRMTFVGIVETILCCVLIIIVQLLLQIALYSTHPTLTLVSLG